jgi:DNA-binding PadR family transcriptional regulator
MFHGNRPRHWEHNKGHHHHEGEPHVRGFGPHHHDEDEHEPGGGFGPGGFGRRLRRWRGGGPGNGGRARRGALRYLLLDTLRDGPKHGYEIIKAFEERTQGGYSPSPGTVYPTLQYLEELGLVRADQETERRVYRLTEAGTAELEAHAEEVKAFWSDFAAFTPSAANQHEVGFLHNELEDLMRTIWQGLPTALHRDNPETIRRIRQAVEQCKNEVRRIITEPGGGGANR